MRSVRFHSVGIVLGLVMLCSAGQAATTSLAPVADGYVRAGAAYENQNFGSATQLVVKDVTDPAYKRVSLLRFDLAGLAGTPTRAVLKLNCTELTQGAATVEAYAVSDDGWAEGSLTWVNQPARDVLLSNVSVSATGAVSLELTAYALHELAGDGVLSVCLVQPANQNRYVVFASREATAGQPALEITTPDVPEAAAVAPNADTYVRAGSGNEITNYGTASSLAIKEVSDAQYKRMSFLRFAIPPAAQAYSKATLRLHCVNLPQGSGTVEAWLVEDDSWSETGMTWLDAPARKSMIASQVVPSLGAVCEIDIISAVQQAQGGDGVLSIALTQPANQDRLVEFASREAEMGRPTLGLSLPAISDTTPPQITATVPAAGGTIAPLAPSVSIAFNEAMDCTSVEAAFSMGNLGGSFSWSGNTVTFKPMPPLEEGTSFTVTIGTGAKDLAGNGLVAPYVFTVNTSLIPGLAGEYFNEMDLTSRRVVRIDPNINFSWGGNSPDPLIEPETYSARWTGLVKSDVAGLHTFTASVDNGVRVSIGGQLIIDDWRDIPPRDVSGTFEMAAGQWYPIIVEHFENWGGASIKLSWARTGMSKRIVPTSAFRIPTDAQSPSTPVNVAAVLLSDRTVILQWPASTDDTIVARYDVYRDGRFIGWTCEPTYRDTNLTPETGYSYQVQASDVVGKRSGLSNPLSVTTKAAPALGDGTGLLAKLYDGMDFRTRKVVRVDPQVAFNWGSSAPATGVSKDEFSIRWEGQIQPLYSEVYKFYTVSDDGIRLWVNGQIVVDHWTNHSATEKSGQIPLKAGEKYDIRMDYYDNTGSAVAKVLWESPSQPKELVPQSQLYPAEWLGGTQVRLLTSVESPVSPAWVEGKCSEDAASIQFSLNGGELEDAVRENPTQWYADTASGEGLPYGIALDAENPTNVSLTVSDSVNTQTYDYSLIWTPTKLNDKSWSKDEIVIRVNDSLLFTVEDADPSGGEGNKNGIVKIDCDGDGKVDYHGQPDVRSPWKYTTPGRYTATAWLRGKECGSLTVVVIDVNLDGPIACEVGFTREKGVEVFPVSDNAKLVFTSQDQDYLGVSVKGLTDYGARLYLSAIQRGTPVLQARVGGPFGPMIRTQEVDEYTIVIPAKQGMVINGKEQTGTTYFEIRPYIPNLTFYSHMFGHRCTFSGGETDLALSTNDFKKVVDAATGETIGRGEFQLECPENESRYCFWTVVDQVSKYGTETSIYHQINGGPCAFEVEPITVDWNNPFGGDKLEVWPSGMNQSNHGSRPAHVIRAEAAGAYGPVPFGWDPPTFHCDYEDLDWSPWFKTTGVPPGKYHVFIDDTKFENAITIKPTVKLELVSPAKPKMALSDPPAILKAKGMPPGGTYAWSDNVTSNKDCATFRPLALGKQTIVVTYTVNGVSAEAQLTIDVKKVVVTITQYKQKALVEEAVRLKAEGHPSVPEGVYVWTNSGTAVVLGGHYGTADFWSAETGENQVTVTYSVGPDSDQDTVLITVKDAVVTLTADRTEIYFDNEVPRSRLVGHSSLEMSEPKGDDVLSCLMVSYCWWIGQEAG